MLFHLARSPWLIEFFSAISHRVSPLSTTYMPSPLPSVAPATDEPDAPDASDEPVKPDEPDEPDTGAGVVVVAGAASVFSVAGGTVSAGVTVAGTAGMGSSLLHATNKGIQANAASNVFISTSIS